MSRWAATRSAGRRCEYAPVRIREKFLSSSLPVMAALGASLQLRASVESRLSDRVADVQRRGNASSVPRSDRRCSAGLLHPPVSGDHQPRTAGAFPKIAMTPQQPRCRARSRCGRTRRLVIFPGAKGPASCTPGGWSPWGQGVPRARGLSAKSRNIRGDRGWRYCPDRGLQVSTQAVADKLMELCAIPAVECVT